MAGDTNFPTALDDDSSLFDVSDGVTTLAAAHHNNLKQAIKAIQAKIGIDLTAVPTALDYRIGHPTGGHRHDGASGQGQQINPSTIRMPTGAYPTSGLTLHDHLLADHAGGAFFEELSPLASWAFRFKQPKDTLMGPYATAAPTTWDKQVLYFVADGDTGLMAWRFLELSLNGAARGGAKEYTKHYLYGGWGLVLPQMATSALHATYSENGQLYYDDANNKLRVRANGTWRSVAFE